MRAYKFITRISKTGSIQIPFTPALFDKDVEVIILPKKSEKEKKHQAEKFVEKWAGFLEAGNIDEVKYDYLSKKYK